MTTRIERCFIANAYRRVYSEEGAYDAFCGYNVICQTQPDAAGWYTFRVLMDVPGVGGDRYPVLVRDEQEAESLAARIGDRGQITDEMWDVCEHHHVNELPDYVLNPDRPEYN